MTKIYEQTTADTCLPSCFLMVLEKRNIAKPNQELELEILVEGDKLSKFNRTIGHLAYVCKKFKLEAEYFCHDNSPLQAAKEILNRMRLSSIKVKKQKVDAKLAKNTLQRGEVIAAIDDFVLREELHFPHYIFIDGFKDDKFTLLDPWDGKKHTLNEKKMNDAISLLDKLGYWRDLILIV